MAKVLKPAMMTSIFQQAALKNIAEKKVPVKLNGGAIDRYRNLMAEAGAPIVAALSHTDETMPKKLMDQLFELKGNNIPVKMW